MPKIAARPYNPDLKAAKLDQVILFFLNDADIAHLGKTKLMKLLYYADFDHFEQYGEPITGARYRKYPHGPVADDAMDAVDRLEAEGRISVSKITVGPYEREQYATIEQFEPSSFSPEELATLYQVANRWSSHTARQIEAATHGEAPWIAVKLNEVIPYHLALYRNYFGEMELDDEEREAFTELDDDDLEEVSMP